MKKIGNLFIRGTCKKAFKKIGMVYTITLNTITTTNNT